MNSKLTRVLLRSFMTDFKIFHRKSIENPFISNIQPLIAEPRFSFDEYAKKQSSIVSRGVIKENYR